ncbi:MAG: hypothetical protein BWY42_01073 [Candidatus Omnitrophica bacterium ADurb.Bin277]|nr:MAG: hypothetical protein BWY42_01073 [Candidatus Omnitrophica bacterium ADurb.Bin277]
MRYSHALVFSILVLVSQPSAALATPWAEKQTYGEKIRGKLAFGLRNTFLGWTEMFSEPKRYKFDLNKSEWEGFCMGISKFVFYTAGGLIQLASFPVPVDFPDVGEGAIPDLGKKKDTPSPWEVHGRSKVTFTPASEIARPKEQSPTPEPFIPPPDQTSVAYEKMLAVSPPVYQAPWESPVYPGPVPPTQTAPPSQASESGPSAPAIAPDPYSRIK